MNRHAMKIPEIRPIVFLHSKKIKLSLVVFFSTCLVFSKPACKKLFDDRVVALPKYKG
jgi:hypothetical protein